jgi:hypothetical protein
MLGFDKLRQREVSTIRIGGWDQGVSLRTDRVLYPIRLREWY